MRLLKILLLPFLLGMFFISAYGQNKNKETENFKLKLEKIDRSWDFTRERNGLSLVKLHEKDLYFKSFGMKVVDSELWLKNHTNYSLMSYSKNLDFLGEYGKKGDGPPEENGQIMFFEILNKNEHYLYDFNKRMFKKMNLNGDVISYHKSKNTIYRGTHLKDDLFLVCWNNPDKNQLFEFIVLDVSNGEIIKIDPFHELAGIDNGPLLEFAYDGNFIKNKKGDVFYYCWMAGLFFKFDLDGNLIFKRLAIDKTPAPKGEKVHLGGDVFTYQATPNVQFFKSASVNDKYLFILSEIAKKNTKEIDYYNVKDGSYVGSIEVPNLDDEQEATMIASEGNDFFILYEDMRIIKYNIKE